MVEKNRVSQKRFIPGLYNVDCIGSSAFVAERWQLPSDNGFNSICIIYDEVDESEAYSPPRFFCLLSIRLKNKMVK